VELSQSDKAIVDEWLDKKGVKGCPLCGKTNKLAPHGSWYGIQAPVPDSPATIKGMSVILLECANCALVLPLHARVLGLHQKEA
jgi:hypothetical protein